MSGLNYIDPALPASAHIPDIRQAWAAFFHSTTARYLSKDLDMLLLLDSTAAGPPAQLDDMINAHPYDTVVSKVPITEIRALFSRFLDDVLSKYVYDKEWDPESTLHSRSNLMRCLQECDLAKDSFAHTAMAATAGARAAARFHFVTFCAHWNAAKDCFVRTHLASLR